MAAKMKVTEVFHSTGPIRLRIHPPRCAKHESDTVGRETVGLVVDDTVVEVVDKAAPEVTTDDLDDINALQLM